MKDLIGDREPVGPSAPASVEAGVPAGLLAEWRAAEERLYPMIMVVPEAYERVVRLVGEAAVELQLSCPDLRALVDAAPDVGARIERLAADGGGSDGLDFPMIAAAACLMRYRQLEEETRRDQRRHLIAAAVEAGADWVTLAEAVPPLTWPALPSTTLRMHVANGRALEQTTTIDGATGGAHFILAEIQLDPATGERRSGEGESEEFEEFDDRQSWQAAIAKRQQTIEANH